MKGLLDHFKVQTKLVCIGNLIIIIIIPTSLSHPFQTLFVIIHQSSTSSAMDHRVSRRTKVLTDHLLLHHHPSTPLTLSPIPCLNYSPPELSNPFAFDVRQMRKLMDAHNFEDRDWLFNLIIQSNLFNRREQAGRVFVSPDFNQSMEQQREITMKRIMYLLDHGVFNGWLTGDGPEAELRKLALHEIIGMYDHSLAVKIGVHIFLWYYFFFMPQL